MAAPESEPPTLNRRRFLAAAAGVGAATVPGASAQSTGGTGAPGGLDAWFEDVSNYVGVADARGQSEVSVDVGVKTIAGPYGFGPAAVRVDPGTTVVWEWTGAGGVHDVAAEDGSFESGLVDEPGATFEHTFDAEGVYRYVCTPHEPFGMKGAVVVGDVEVGGSEEDAAAGEPDYGDWFDDVGNYESTVDARDGDGVTVAVGTMVDGAPFGYEPAAVRVAPGTTVTWEWTGDGGAHDVSSTDGAFQSELVDAAGHTFAHTFEDEGIYRYVCTPHEPFGMKGAVVVGDAGGSAEESDLGETLLVGGFGGLLMAALLLVPLSELRRSGRRHAN